MAKKGFLTIFDLENQIIQKFQDIPDLKIITINDRFNDPHVITRLDVQKEGFLKDVIEKYLGAVESTAIEEEAKDIPNEKVKFVLDKLIGKVRYNKDLIDEEAIDYDEKDVELTTVEIETNPNIYIESDVSEDLKEVIFELNV